LRDKSKKSSFSEYASRAAYTDEHIIAIFLKIIVTAENQNPSQAPSKASNILYKWSTVGSKWLDINPTIINRLVKWSGRLI